LRADDNIDDLDLRLIGRAGAQGMDGEIGACALGPSPYLTGSMTTFDLSLLAHCSDFSAQVPISAAGKLARRISSAVTARDPTAIPAMSEQDNPLHLSPETTVRQHHQLLPRS
jgi:hypothetical protein